MEQAIKVAEKKDEAHFSYAKLIYNKELLMPDVPYDGWSLDKALEEARKAEQINPLDVYRHEQAVILFAQKKWRESYDIYTTLFQGNMRSPELFYEASRCQQQLGGRHRRRGRDALSRGGRHVRPVLFLSAHGASFFTLSKQARGPTRPRRGKPLGRGATVPENARRVYSAFFFASSMIFCAMGPGTSS